MTKKHLRRSISFLTSLSIICGSLSIAHAQLIADFAPAYRDSDARDEVYAEIFRRARGADFENLLIRHTGIESAPSVLDWFDSNNADLFRVLDTAYQNKLEEVRGKLAGDKNTPAAAPPPRTRRAAFDRDNNIFWQNATYKRADDIVITKTETDDGFEMGAAQEKTKTVGDVTVTHGAAGKSRAFMVEGGNVGNEYKAVEFTEIDNRAERTKMRTEVTTSWRISTASCPDANGISAGTETMTNGVKITITTPHTTGILNRDITTTMTIKGTVNDAAELSHFDIAGTSTETITGYDRAERLDLIENAEFTDGTRTLNYRVTNGKLGKSVKNEYGFTKKLAREFGDITGSATPGTTAAESERIDKIGGRHVGWIAEQAAMALEIAQQAWRYEGCVTLKLTAPKMRLAPDEQVNVSAETHHKFDKTRVNADLVLKSASVSATPERQRGETEGIFNLTAPPKGSKASIVVESISKRGMAFEILQFDEERAVRKPPPSKTPPPTKACNGGWTGKIKAVKTKRTDTTKPASGRLVRSIENKEETFSIDYHVLGIPDRSQGFTNAYLSDAQMNYRATEYRESNYAPGKMSCDKAIITTQQTQKFEGLMTALSSARITVYITSVGEKGVLTFDSPEIQAERIITRTYESSCPSYNQVNSGVDRSDGLIGVPSPGFEIYFELDAKSNSTLKGAKRIENSDGSFTTVTWDLTRSCE
jgi:hypothetical protein